MDTPTKDRNDGTGVEKFNFQKWVGSRKSGKIFLTRANSKYLKVMGHTISIAYI